MANGWLACYGFSFNLAGAAGGEVELDGQPVSYKVDKLLVNMVAGE